MLLLAEEGDKGTAEAITLLEHLKDLYPPNALVEFHLARAQLMKGNEKAASENLDRALGIQPDMREALILQGRLRLSQARFDDVARSMESLLRKQPGEIEATLLLSEACRKSGKAGEAAAALARIPNQPDSNVRWLMEKGLVSKNLGKTGDARSSFDKVRTLEPSNLSAATELVALDIAARDYDSALRLAEKQRQLHPESAIPVFLRAMVLARQSRLKEAEEELKTVLRLDPGMVAAYQLLVGIYSTTGRTAEAIEQMEELRKIDAGNIPVLMTLAGIYEGTAGRKADARKCYEEILNKDPKFVPALNNLAVILGESTGDDLAKAQGLALQARISKADDPAIADTLGWILFKQGDFKRAYALLGEAAAAIPDDPQVKFHRGMACRAMGDEQGACRAFSEAIAAKSGFPGRAEALGHLSRLEAVIEPGDVGILNLKEQVRQDPSDVIARLRLGNLLEIAEKYGEAAEVYAGALTVNPELPRAVSRLAHLYAAPLNEPEKAYEFARRAKDLDPGDAQAAAIMGKLAFHAGEYERAHLMFQESLSKIKEDTSLMIEGAWAAYCVGRLDDAGNLMATVIARSKDPKEMAGGKQFLKFLKADCTADEIADALESDPDFVPALMARAALAENDHQTSAALQDYQKALKVFPKFIPASSAIKRLQPKKAPES
jgi:tetratricopeptide (TPR) repeat protein